MARVLFLPQHGYRPYPEALPESARTAGYVSFDPGQLEVWLDGARLLLAADQRS